MIGILQRITVSNFNKITFSVQLILVRNTISSVYSYPKVALGKLIHFDVEDPNYFVNTIYFQRQEGLSSYEIQDTRT